MLTKEYYYKILKALESEPHISQREFARRLDISLGTASIFLKALTEKGVIKSENFKNYLNKKGYLYLLTLNGIEEKGILTKRFLERKIKEYEYLASEIEIFW